MGVFLPQVSTTSFVEEIPTDGHSPLKFFVDENNDVYFCKYRITNKDQELTCLIYEVVCTFLLKHLEIPTPDIALVEITPESFDKKALRRNKKYLKGGEISFGSKEVQNAQLITNLNTVKTQADFSKLSNPEDLIRIAIFDLWLDNRDRGKSSSDFAPGRSNNYNLLLAPTEDGSQNIVAFDHSFTFGGENNLVLFLEDINTIGKVVNTPYFKEVCRFIEGDRRKKIVTTFIAAIKAVNVPDLVKDIFLLLPEDWKRVPDIEIKICTFLTNKDRIKEVEELILTHLSALTL